MSHENVEIVRRSIEAWNERGLTTWTASLHPDAEIDWSRSRAPFKGVYRGRDGAETFWDVFWSTFEDVRVETHGFRTEREALEASASGSMRDTLSTRSSGSRPVAHW